MSKTIRSFKHNDIHNICYLVNLSFPSCVKDEIWDLTVCIVVDGEKFKYHYLDLDWKMPKVDSSELFPYRTMCVQVSSV